MRVSKAIDCFYDYSEWIQAAKKKPLRLWGE